MKRKFLFQIVLSLGCTLLFLFSCAQEKSEAQSESAVGLSADAQKVVDYLLEDWNKQFRSTNIDMAMSNLGLPANDDLRLQIGHHLREHTDLANNLKWWGANNYILNDDEKVIAKYLINTYDAEQHLPDVQETSEAVGFPESDLKARLAFMAQAGLLQQSSEEKLGYALSEGYGKWGGPFRYNFHTVAVAGEKPFGVW
ncbi:MAG: hypothetical protein ACE5IR_26495 [bacterium]